MVHTKIRQEKLALENLERQGFECFLPQFQVEKLRQNTLQVMYEALFPRYLFIRLSTGREGPNWSPIRSTVGVSRLVTFGNIPAKIPDELVTLIRTQTDDSSKTRHYFEPGEEVMLTDGPFIGLHAIYQMKDGEGRVMVLLNILSKPVKIFVAPRSLRKVS